MQGGAVRLSGHDVRDLTADSIRGTLGVETQDGHLLHDTIAANLRDPEFRQQVRSKLMKGWEAHDSENFILISNCSNKAIITKLVQDLEIMRKCYLERFPPIGPMEKVSLVRVFKNYDEYAAYGKLPGAIGHFSPLDDELVLFDPGTKIPKRSEWLKDVDTAEVRLSDLARLPVADIDLLALKAAGLVPAAAKAAKIIKTGKLEKAVKLTGLTATRGAKAAIEAAGGSIASTPA